MDLVEVDHVDAEPAQADASQAARMRSGAEALDPPGSETEKRTLVATTTSSRCCASHGASVRSDRPSP